MIKRSATARSISSRATKRRCQDTAFTSIHFQSPFSTFPLLLFASLAWDAGHLHKPRHMKTKRLFLFTLEKPQKHEGESARAGRGASRSAFLFRRRWTFRFSVSFIRRRFLFEANRPDERVKDAEEVGDRHSEF